MAKDVTLRRIGLAAVTAAAAFLAGARWAWLLDRIPLPSEPLEEVRQVVASREEGAYLALVTYGPAMAGVSGHRILRLHSAGGAVIDEVVFGEFPLEVVAWSRDAVTLAVPGFEQAGHDRDAYIRPFLDRNRAIGRYALSYDLTRPPPAR